jgi:hypothetical protein
MSNARASAALGRALPDWRELLAMASNYPIT